MLISVFPESPVVTVKSPLEFDALVFLAVVFPVVGFLLAKAASATVARVNWPRFNSSAAAFTEDNSFCSNLSISRRSASSLALRDSRLASSAGFVIFRRIASEFPISALGDPRGRAAELVAVGGLVGGRLIFVPREPALATALIFREPPVSELPEFIAFPEFPDAGNP